MDHEANHDGWNQLLYHLLQMISAILNFLSAIEMVIEGGNAIFYAVMKI